MMGDTDPQLAISCQEKRLPVEELGCCFFLSCWVMASHGNIQAMYAVSKTMVFSLPRDSGIPLPRAIQTEVIKVKLS